MSPAVNQDPVTPDTMSQDRRAARRAATERSLVEAASALFLDRGYAATTLADVAARAGVAPRTVYVRFATKADLLLRCVSSAIAGDDDPAPIAQRTWMTDAMSAPTLDERIRLMASVTATLMRRAGPLLAVATEAAPSEPAIAAAAAAGRGETRRTLGEFWRRLQRDGLLPAAADVDWLAETATLTAHAETFLVLIRTTGWDLDDYGRWLETTWHRLVAGSTHPVAAGAGRPVTAADRPPPRRPARGRSRPGR